MPAGFLVFDLDLAFHHTSNSMALKELNLMLVQLLYRFLSQIVRDGLVSSTLQQELDDLSMPIVACSPERGAAQIVPRVWVCPS